ncbi:hypothetical protein OURE66S_04225 [Oligella ureolytica]
MTPEQIRWGFEILNIDDARLEETGMAGMVPPCSYRRVKTTLVVIGLVLRSGTVRIGRSSCQTLDAGRSRVCCATRSTRSREV